MRKLSILVIMILAAFLNSADAAKATYKAFTPEGAGNHEFLQSGQKKLKYFVLDEGKTLAFSVRGTNKAKIRIRPQIEKDHESVEFEIQVWEGNKLISGKKVSSAASKSLSGAENISIGAARDIFIKIPKGKHNYKVKLVSSNVKKFYLRFYQTSKKRSTKYSTYKPAEFKETAILESKKSGIAYYLINNDGGVELSVFGPADIKIYCRANFDKTMKEKSKFALGIFEAGEEVAKFTGIAKKSLKSAYNNRKDLIPSTLHKYSFKVPSGKHIYTLKKLNSAAPNLSVRFKMNANNFGKIK